MILNFVAWLPFTQKTVYLSVMPDAATASNDADAARQTKVEEGSEKKRKVLSEILVRVRLVRHLPNGWYSCLLKAMLTISRRTFIAIVKFGAIFLRYKHNIHIRWKYIFPNNFHAATEQNITMRLQHWKRSFVSAYRLGFSVRLEVWLLARFWARFAVR